MKKTSSLVSPVLRKLLATLVLIALSSFWWGNLPLLVCLLVVGLLAIFWERARSWLMFLPGLTAAGAGILFLLKNPGLERWAWPLLSLTLLWALVNALVELIDSHDR